MGLRESCDPWRPCFLISTSSLVMIQRIQSLYLLIGIVLLSLVFFLPVWSWTAAAGNLYYNFSPFGVSTNDTNFSSPLWFSLLMVVSVGGALALDTWALFAFKSQARQMTFLRNYSLLVFTARCFGSGSPCRPIFRRGLSIPVWPSSSLPLSWCCPSWPSAA